MPKAIQCNNTIRNIVLFSQTGFPEQETCNITATCLQDIIVVKNSREEPSFSKKPGAAGCDSEHLLSEPGSSENVRPTNGFFGRMWHPAFQRAVGIVAGLVLTATVGRKIYSTYGNVNPSTENRSVEKNDSLSFAVHQIVQGNNAYSMQRLNAIQQDSHKNAGLNASENSLTNHSSVTREFKITLHEYLKEIEVIGKLAPLHLDDFYNKVFNVDMKIRVQRSHNDLKEKKISVSEEINFFLNDPMIDWRIRNELHLLYSKANETVEVSNAKNGQVRDAKLILACIDLTLHYLHENRKNGLSGVSFIYGVFFIDKLLLILDEVKLARKGGEGKRLRQDVKLYISDIYSNKNVDMPYDVMDMYKHTITHGQVLHKNRNDYFYSAIREHVLKGENVTAQKPEKDEVKIIDLTFCQKERENPTLSDTLRLIAKAIKHPLSTLAEEGRILYDYNVKEEGCATDMHIVELTKKIDESIDLLMEWVPHYNRGRMILSMAATSMDMIADAIDGNELSVSSVSEIYGYFISFTKDLLSSLSAKQINDMESKNLEDEILKMTRKIKHTNNRLTIETSDPDEITFIDREYGNFVDEMSKKVIYYNDDNAWHISPDVRFTPETKKILENTYGIYQQGYDIYLIKNSSPDLYADGTLARIDDILHVFVDNEMYSVSETLISDGVYRYVANKDDVFTPVVNIGGVWEFESKHSP
ncbi:hypothetical protein, partial [Candidatus Symbiopectobacterium sp. NZEC135]|uniref:hypothetical protein n=1 Tax=Candidatus Symbiopectobacterium sp. NZEC135 TaxID=2820471 RepID=UPI0022275321